MGTKLRMLRFLLSLLFLESCLSQELPAFTCGDVTQAKEFEFVSPAYPVSVGLSSLECAVTVDHGCKEPGQPDQDSSATCQLRLDFEEFNVQPPLLGMCHFDKFFVSANGKYPLLCGENTGHHLYLDVADRASTDLTFMLAELEHALYNCSDKFGVFESNMSPDPLLRQLADPNNLPQLSFPTRRAWKIKVQQIPCGCVEDNKAKKAPTGCLQYYGGITGNIKSFNYDQVSCFSNDHYCEPGALDACDIYAGYTGHLNNMDYTVCIEQEYGFCGTEYYQAMEPGSFTLTNATNLEENLQDPVVTGDEHGASCNSDYILLPGGHCKNDITHYSTDRFCGNSLGVGGIRQPNISYSRPFLFRVVTDNDEITESIDYMNRGFHLKYHQLPCSAAV